jgi:DNA-binding CsgD family transcriptional regulator/tetratricopeptide (TPR) repeat protein
MLTSWPLVGRSRELEWLADVLAGGEHFAAVLAGRAGVGKTRLASECLAVAEARGRVTARIKAGQSARRLPFGALAPLLPGVSAPSIEPADMLRRARDDIVALGAGRALVLLVDDAHLLDDASATLVHQLVSSRSAFVIATVRTEEPAPEPIVALWKDELAERLELQPLAPCSVEALLTSVLDGPVSGATLHQLGERSAGNALYLRELVLAGIESGDLTNEDGIWRLSDSPAVSSRLIELVEARLGAVQDPERKVLEALAFGEPLGIGCLKTLTTGRKLEELEERGLIVTGYDGRRLEARLGHPLYGEVIRARIPAIRSQAVRQNLASRVQAAGARRREDALRFATWRLDAGGDMAPDLMVAAAVTARNRWDLDLARRLADAAVRAGAGVEAALLQAEVAVLQGRGPEAEHLLAALPPLATNDAQRARVVAARVEYLISRLGRIDEAVQVATDAEGLLTDPGALDLVIAKRAFALQAGGRLREALDALDPVLGRAEGPPLAFAWWVGGACLVRIGRFAEALAFNGKCDELDADRTGSPPLNPTRRQTVRCGALIGAGQLQDAEQVAATGYASGVANGYGAAQGMFAFYLARIELITGKVVDARRHALEARDIFRQRQWFNMSRSALSQLAMAHALGGSAQQARAALAELDALGMPSQYLNDIERDRAHAWAAAADGDVSAAGDQLRSAAASARCRDDFLSESEALHDLARLGWPEDAATRLRELVDLIEGRMAEVRADHAAALVAVDPLALAGVSLAFEAMGAWLYAAEASASAAVALRRAGEPRRAVAAEVRAADLARQCQGAMTPALRAIQTQALLSSREIEVAALAAAGLANKEIAGRLAVSVRTVENHLQRVYEKLGVARRADLGQALSGTLTDHPPGG